MVLIGVGQFISPVLTYSSGAPDIACKLMKPAHGYDAQNNSINPSNVELNVNDLINVQFIEVSPGQALTIELKTTDGGHFKGFMVQVGTKKNMMKVTQRA